MKEKIYKLSNFLQIIITKNMSFFIALGIFRILNLKWEKSFEIVELLVKYIIPVTIAYTTGNLIEKKYGAITSVLASVIYLVIFENSNILTIILLSSFSSLIIKEIKNRLILKYFSSLEMLGINLIIPIVAIITGVFMSIINKNIGEGFGKIVNLILEMGENIWFIFFITPIIEISKVFFLNNIVNRGVLFFLGYEEMLQRGSSLFFLLETNPGPGLGILLSYYFFRKDKKHMLNTITLEFFGGIHEFYFPYIIKNLKLLFPLIIGGIVGNLFFYIFGVALYGLPSPGSIILISLFSNSKLLFLILGVVLSAFITFVGSYLILKNENEDFKENMKEEEKIFLKKDIKKIGVVCISGAGTSTIGRNFLVKELEKNGYEDIKVENYSIEEVETDVDIIITHKNLKNNVEKIYKEKVVIALENYLDKEFYIDFIKNYLKEPENQKEEDIIIEVNQKEILISEEEEKKILIINKKIGIIEGENKKLLIKHYPYGVNIREDELFMIIYLPKNFTKSREMTEKIKSLTDKEIENLEIIDNEKEIIELLELEKILEVKREC